MKNELQKSFSRRERQYPLSGSSIWNSQDGKKLTFSPHKKSESAIDQFDISSPHDENVQCRVMHPMSSKKLPSSLTTDTLSSTGIRTQVVPLLNRSRSIRLDPKFSKHNHQHRFCSTIPSSNVNDESSKNIGRTPMDSQDILPEIMSNARRADASTSSSDSNSLALSPIVTFSNQVNHFQTKHQENQQSYQYHQSPHWTGKVRINPFSPVPEQFLQYPRSAKSLPAMNCSRGLPELCCNDIGPLSLLTESPKSFGVKKTRRLKPKNVPFEPSIIEHKIDDTPLSEFYNRVSPTDDTEVTIDANIIDVCPHDSTSRKRKAEAALGLPQYTGSFGDGARTDKKRRQKGSRYLEDFEEVRHLGSGSFGCVNACLSRLDGCMYAIKSISPLGIRRSARHEIVFAGYSLGGSHHYNYNNSQLQPSIPPTPRRVPSNFSMQRRTNLSISSLDCKNGGSDESLNFGSKHWTESALRRMLREVHALAALCNQADIRTFHIVRYHQAWFEDDGTLYIQTELCSATLRDEMTQSQVVKTSRSAADLSRKYKCLQEILLALELVHSKGMVHLDIKPENIFIKNGLHKLGDFGLAGIASSTSDIEEGDSRYMSREILEEGPRDLTKCDIFSLGATIYELCHNISLPSCGVEWHDLRNGKLSPFWPLWLYDIVREMMHPDPMRRPSATDLLSRQEWSSCLGVLVPVNTTDTASVTSRNKTVRLTRALSWNL